MIRLTLFIVYMTIASVSCFSQQYGSFKDPRDGRVYKTVKIGSQEWMAENLNASLFRNGDTIQEAKTPMEWKRACDEKIPAWCYYENKTLNGQKYGKLYNFYASIDPRGLAPIGFHIPRMNEWKILYEELSDNFRYNAGKRLKSVNGWANYKEGGVREIVCPNCEEWNADYRKQVPCHRCKNTRWVKVNYPIVLISGNGDNSSGFNAYASGFRAEMMSEGYIFLNLGYRACWWSAKIKYEPMEVFETSNEGGTGFWELTDNYGEYGFSVRCIKD